MRDLRLFFVALTSLLLITQLLFAQPEGKLIDNWLVYGVADFWTEGIIVDLDGILDEVPKSKRIIFK